MAEHEVSLEIPRGIEVGKRDLKIRVVSDGVRFGTLTISKGAIDWRPGHAKRGKSRHIQLGWAEFDAAMERTMKRRGRKRD